MSLTGSMGLYKVIFINFSESRKVHIQMILQNHFIEYEGLNALKVKVKLPVCLTKYHVRKTYGGVEV